MMKWFKKNQSTVPSINVERPSQVLEPKLNLPPTSEASVNESPQGFFTRMKQGLSKTRQQLGGGLSRLFLGKKQIDAALLDDLETLLLSSDIGIEVTQNIIQSITERLGRKDLADGEAVFAAVKESLSAILAKVSQPFLIEHLPAKPFVILMVGVNGAGKTTTIGKLAQSFKQKGHQVMLAAGDTFRAAAVEQLERWGERNQVPVIAQHTGADSASVIFDALQAARARGMDVLMADTAGRLHTQSNLMQELQKIKRVLQKQEDAAPHETWLVLDASIGQNALSQARQFHESIGLTGIVMTKLDGTAKGGILFAIAHELGIPFRFIGVGEGIDDLRPFDSEQFVDAILNDDHI